MNADTSFVPPLVYAVFGVSRDIAIGPVAVVSILLGTLAMKELPLPVSATDRCDTTSTDFINDACSAYRDAYLGLIFTATFFAGVFQAALGLLRFGQWHQTYLDFLVRKCFCLVGKWHFHYQGIWVVSPFGSEFPLGFVLLDHGLDTFRWLIGWFFLCRLGFIVDFLSHAAIVGFMGGAAITIGLQQLKGLLGISTASFTKKTDIISVLNSVFEHTTEVNRTTWQLCFIYMPEYI